jgi:hypothetical protein
MAGYMDSTRRHVLHRPYPDWMCTYNWQEAVVIPSKRVRRRGKLEGSSKQEVVFINFLLIAFTDSLLLNKSSNYKL